MSDLRFIKDFQGFSGCHVTLYSKNGSYFVRKVSKSKDYNFRLEKQMQKQRYFLENLSTNDITAPIIYSSGLKGDLFYFDMEYVNGISIIDYIQDSNLDELAFIGEKLLQIVNIIKLKKTGKRLYIFEKSLIKIRNIKNIFSPESQLSIQHNLLKLENSFILQNKNSIPETFCHGDLTMQNIMFDRKTKKFYLIDFLDSFSDSYWIDISKMFQDVEGKWYAQMKKSYNTNSLNLKMMFLERYIKKKLTETEQEYLKNHYLLLSLVFARIIPYATEEQFSFLNHKINKYLEKHLVKQLI